MWGTLGMMSKQPIRHFFTNIICGCVYNKDDRKKLRVLLNSPVMSYLRFVRADLGVKIRRFRTFVGYQARSLLIGVNDKYIYKFPLRRDNYRELAMREKRVTDALRAVSPLYIPNVEVLNYNGMLVRKYDLIRGKQCVNCRRPMCCDTKTNWPARWRGFCLMSRAVTRSKSVI